jgi:prophage antirepressor-like protein
MSQDLVVKHFEGKAVAFHDDCGKLTLTMKEAGELLGYKQPAKSVSNLFNEHKDEFDNDCTQITVSVIREVGAPPVRERCFTLDGLILLCMFSEQKIAKNVRHWLRRVGREVAVTGSYNAPVLSQILNQMNETLRLQGNMVQNLAAEVHEMREWRAQTFIPAQADNSYWPTPTERIKSIIPSVHRLPAYFNRGGSFDIYCTLRHAQSRGGLLSQRNRRSRGKMPDYVIQPCPENDAFLREALEVWLINLAHPKQAKLKLAVSNKGRHAPGAP